MTKAIPGREIYAVALALLLATSMTEDQDPQADQARILNEILTLWPHYLIPWWLITVK